MTCTSCSSLRGVPRGHPSVRMLFACQRGWPGVCPSPAKPLAGCGGCSALGSVPALRAVLGWVCSPRRRRWGCSKCFQVEAGGRLHCQGTRGELEAFHKELLPFLHLATLGVSVSSARLLRKLKQTPGLREEQGLGPGIPWSSPAAPIPPPPPICPTGGEVCPGGGCPSPACGLNW